MTVISKLSSSFESTAHLWRAAVSEPSHSWKPAPRDVSKRDRESPYGIRRVSPINAEGEGFEPSIGLPIAVFMAAHALAADHAEGPMFAGPQRFQDHRVSVSCHERATFDSASSRLVGIELTRAPCDASVPRRCYDCSWAASPSCQARATVTAHRPRGRPGGRQCGRSHRCYGSPARHRAGDKSQRSVRPTR